MLSSTLGAANSMAAANMETEMVLPKRRGVEMRTSEARLFHELARRISACCCAKVPGFSILKNVRVHAESVFKCVRCAVSMVYEFEEDPLSIVDSTWFVQG